MRATLSSEWGKTWSVRSPWLCLAGMVGLIVVTAASLANDFLHGISIGEVEPAATMPTSDAAAPAVLAGLVVFAAFAMLPVTGEYSTGTLRSTLLAQPRRQLVLACKAAITATSGLVVGGLAGGLAEMASGLVLGARAEEMPGSSLATLARVAMLLALAGVLVVGLAVIVRSAVGTLAAAFVLLTGTLALPERLAVWLPGGAAAEFLSGGTERYPLATGLLVVGGWAVVAYAAGAWLLERRDA